MRHRYITFAVAGFLLQLSLVPAFTGPLKVAPGRDPGGVAVGVLVTEFDVSRPEIAARLARDGEGVAIGWDFSTKNDDVSAAQPPVPTALVSSLANSTDIRIVTALVDPTNPLTWAKAVAFVARTPARIVAVPQTPSNGDDWAAFRAAAEGFQDVLFIVSADTHAGLNAPSPASPAAFNLSNVLSVTTQNAARADIAVALGSDWATQSTFQRADAAIAITIKTLITCVLGEQTLAGPNAKSWALMGLAALLPSPGKATHEALLLKPCAEAETGSHRSD